MAAMFPDQHSIDTFLRDYWQKKPLLLKQALPGFTDPLSPEELAGLACESFVESRLVRYRNRQWHLQNGPFEESLFAILPDDDWTLLVQRVDHFIPALKKLLRQVSFVPRWRVDDVMVSYAEAGGGAGPHFDHYDVFIIQGLGSRCWKTGQHCKDNDLLRSDSGLRILEHFDTRQEWKLEPGDVLYIPPGVAHWGVALDSSLSYSIGFRAPSLREMILGFGDEICDHLDEDQRYGDPDLHPATRTGEISIAVLEKMEQMLTSALNDRLALARWLGKSMTAPDDPDLLDPAREAEPQPIQQLLASRPGLTCNPASRFSWTALPGRLLLFADGELLETGNAGNKSRQLAELLAGTDYPQPLPLDEYCNDPDCIKILAWLYNQGSLVQAQE
ncbi:MAG: cupin domain-containing protein [Pseudohongiellaceae bacterium]